MPKLRVGVIFGGRSGEHDVSLMSAASIMDAIDREQFEVVPIGITRAGRWITKGDPLQSLQDGQLGHSAPAVLLPDPTRPGPFSLPDPAGESLAEPWHADPAVPQIDVFFPVLHGPNGEDGTIQGLLELAEVPYVGAGVAASAVGMDKALMKALLRQAGLPMVDFMVVKAQEWEQGAPALTAEVTDRIGFPSFVKPANMGSSVGVSRVATPDALPAAISQAFIYDRKVLVEQAAQDCREIEVSVLGNDEPQASVPGEIIPGNDFYDYQAKYVDDTSDLIIPAPLSPAVAEKTRQYALQAFLAIDCAGLARVDFFVHKDTEAVFVNEINTMPGFTRISMYPKLWEASGVPYKELINRLIELALERHRSKARDA